MSTILEELRQKIAPERVLTKEPMKKHTTFRIGGEAELYVVPETYGEVQWTVKTDGIVLQIYKNMNEITVNRTEITAQAGALLSSIASEALNQNLTGFEFAGGIPGTFGGAITMNAGAYGGEMIQVLKEATVLTKEGDILTLTGERCSSADRRRSENSEGEVRSGPGTGSETGRKVLEEFTYEVCNRNRDVGGRKEQCSQNAGRCRVFLCG